ncbi:MAG: peptide deformylase [Acidimicrobiales bacterium]
MIYDIVQVGDPVLRRPARPVEVDDIVRPFLQELIVSMRHTMYDAPGVGLAAPQVGESLQVLVLEDGPEYLDSMSRARRAELRRDPLPFAVLINPRLETVGEETDEAFEGCLSISGYAGVVRRNRTVRVHAVDATGSPVSMTLEGWPARIVQHEIDHLAGVLYVDRMDMRTFTTTDNLGRWFKARPIDEVRAILTPG